MFRSFVAFFVLLILRPEVSPATIAVRSADDGGNGFYTIYYHDESFLKRGVCNPDVIPDPSLCTEKIPEDSRKLLPLLEHTTGVYLPHFKKLFAKVSPRQSELTKKMINVLERQNAKIAEFLETAETLSEDHVALLERQRKINDADLAQLKVQAADSDNWLALLRSPVVFRYDCDGAKGDGACEDLDQKLRPFIAVTEQVFRLVEYEEYDLHDWTCTVTCEVTKDFRWNTSNSYFSPFGGFSGHDAGDGQTTTSNSFPWATGQKTREASEAIAKAQCTGQSYSKQTDYQRKDYNGQRASSTTTVTASVKDVSCSVKKPNPPYSPRPFPY